MAKATASDDGSNFIEDLENEARAQLGALREYRTYAGQNPEYRQRAKLAIGVVGAYVRLRATLANEKSNELIERRLLGGGAAPPQLGDGSK